MRTAVISDVHANLPNADFEKADLRGANLTGANLERANFVKSRTGGSECLYSHHMPRTQ